jgi:hypothetical protein
MTLSRGQAQQRNQRMMSPFNSPFAVDEMSEVSHALQVMWS